MGRDLDCGVNETKSLVVSIHAPAWGATYKAIDTGLEQYVSIHAPAWGATPAMGCFCGKEKSFNPRARMGRDPALFAVSFKA